MVPKAYLAEVCGQRRRLWVRSNLRLCQALVIPCATRSQLRHVVRAEVQRDRLGQTTAPNRPGGRQPELILRTKESTRCEHSRPAACMITHARGRSCLARAQLAPARSASVFTAVSSGRGGSGRRTIFERTRAVSAAWLFRCACTTDRSVASCTPSTQERTTPPALRQNSAPALAIRGLRRCERKARRGASGLTVSWELAGHRSCAAIGANKAAMATNRARRRRIVAPLRCSRSAHTASLRAPAREGLEARLSPALDSRVFLRILFGE
jgi:hypothetical protein